jgi:hypothetical protein
MVSKNQMHKKRLPVMRKVFNSYFPNKQKSLNCLEICVWFGEGSTKLWMELLPNESILTLVDEWKPYASPEDKLCKHFDYAEMDNKVYDALKNTIDVIKNYETFNNANNLTINLIRASSNFFFKTNKTKYDFIYIDGDHKYFNFSQDITNSIKSVKVSNFLICGDDLEIYPTQELYDFLQPYKNIDFITDKKFQELCIGKKSKLIYQVVKDNRNTYIGNDNNFSSDDGGFHPGVLMGLHENFQDLYVENGFWWIDSKSQIKKK